MSALVKIDGLSRVFDVSKPWLNRVVERLPKAMLTAVSDVSLEIPERSVYALVGESGSGKSTIGKIAVGLLAPSDGRVEIEGVDLFREADDAKVEAVRSDIQMIFQDPYASLNPRWKVRDIIAEPLEVMGLTKNRQETDERVREIAAKCRLNLEHLRRFPHAFSGGQRQRISIARALVSDPKFVVADESVAALDVSIQ
ncbi:MAG: dipeptide/oligopeptide/nickel ABC transporter ATP-binding protein, partial [Pseudomonadota bacterium]